MVSVLTVLGIAGLTGCVPGKGSCDEGTHNEQTGAREDIESAIERAQKKNKMILLIFGADWCPWCTALHELLEKNGKIRDFLDKCYEVVFIDVGRKDKNMDINERYGNPIQFGLPVIVVLDGEGNYMTTQETGVLENEDQTTKGHNPEKVLTFLEKWVHRM